MAKEVAPRLGEEKPRHRFFAAKADDPLFLSESEHRHLTQVLRARVGEEVIVCTGDGYDYLYKIEAISRDETKLSLLDKRPNECDASVRVTLFCAVLKGDKNDLVAQKATELGVYEICPVVTKYVQAHDRTVRTERLEKIVHEAAKQCGRSGYPAIAAPVEFGAFLPKLAAFDLIVFPYEKAVTPSLKTFLRSEWEEKGENVRRIAVIVGPEGGFADEEADALVRAGVTPVTLGKRILRAETANIAVLSAVMYETEQWQ